MMRQLYGIHKNTDVYNNFRYYGTYISIYRDVIRFVHSHIIKYQTLAIDRSVRLIQCDTRR